jgi:hypothetical protein
MLLVLMDHVDGEREEDENLGGGPALSEDRREAEKHDAGQRPTIDPVANQPFGPRGRGCN